MKSFWILAFLFVPVSPAQAVEIKVIRNDVLLQSEDTLDLTLIADFERPFDEAVVGFDLRNWGRCSRHFNGTSVQSESEPGADWSGVVRLKESMLFLLGQPTAGYLTDFRTDSVLTSTQYRIDYSLVQNHSAYFLLLDLSGKMTMNDGYVLLTKLSETSTRLTVTKAIRIELESPILQEILLQMKDLLPGQLLSMASDLIACDVGKH
jgi:hypothetical protein